MSDIKIRSETNGDRTLPVFAEMDRKFDAVRERAFDLFSSRGGTQGGDLDDWITAERELMGWSTVEMKERANAFELDVTLPGFSVEDVELTTTPNELIVHAEKKNQNNGENERVVWSEFGSNAVYRRVALPADVDTDGVTAEMKNGVLRVNVPKHAATNG